MLDLWQKAETFMNIREIRAFVREANHGRPIKVEQSRSVAEAKRRGAKRYDEIAADISTPECEKYQGPLITLYPVFFTLGRAGKRFILLHEVGHLIIDIQKEDFDIELEEEAANCWAQIRAQEMGIRTRKPNDFCNPRL